MKVLGITHDVLICSAAVVDDGEVVSAIAEERLDRQKQSRRLSAARDRALPGRGRVDPGRHRRDRGRLEPVDRAARPCRVGSSPRRWRSEHLTQVPGPPDAQIDWSRAVGRGHAGRRASRAHRRSPSSTHYDAHIGSSYFLSPWDEAAIAHPRRSGGDQHRACWRVGRGAEVEILAEVDFPHSLGLFYGTVTQFLGFKPDSDEWKVMALGVVRRPGQRVLREAEPADPRSRTTGRSSWRSSTSSSSTTSDPRMYSDRFVRDVRPPRGARRRARADATSSSPRRCSRCSRTSSPGMLTILHERTGLDRVALCGGCFMNSVFNGKIARADAVPGVVHLELPRTTRARASAPPCGSRRSAPGANASAPAAHNYWGPAYTDDECLDGGRAATGCRTSRSSTTRRRERRRTWSTAGSSAGSRAGWSSASGPSGNRSILLDPRRPDGKDVVNAAVKFREAFPPVRAGDPRRAGGRVVRVPRRRTRCPFMERVFPFQPGEGRARCRRSCTSTAPGRLQTVDGRPRPRATTRSSRSSTELTGVPIVLNTSFNLNGEPIVCSPEDAIRTFFTCALDVLYLGNVRIAK